MTYGDTSLREIESRGWKLIDHTTAEGLNSALFSFGKTRASALTIAISWTRGEKGWRPKLSASLGDTTVPLTIYVERLLRSKPAGEVAGTLIDLVREQQAKAVAS